MRCFSFVQFERGCWTAGSEHHLGLTEISRAPVLGDVTVKKLPNYMVDSEAPEMNPRRASAVEIQAHDHGPLCFISCRIWACSLGFNLKAFMLEHL